MKKCLECDAIFVSTLAHCPVCGYAPNTNDGVPLYAPLFTNQSSGFKAGYFQELFRLESAYFWFRARNRLIIWALSRYASGFHSFLEVGCGTGYVLSGIAKAYPNAHLQGSELFSEGLKFAVERQPAIHFMQMDARKIPFVDEFDVIGAFDVIEHIEEDEQALKQMYGALKVGGIMLLTVPQHKWLWSSVDEYACHVRRYTANELHEKVELSGFEILRSTSFVFGLLPAMWASRFTQKNRDVSADPLAEFGISPWLNRIFEFVMSAEILLIRAGLNFPLGGSRLIVAIKK